MIPIRVVEVAMRVDDHADGRGRQLAEVVDDLAGLLVGGSGVDDERLAVTQHDPDVLVEEGVAPDEDAIADLDPASHPGMVRGAPRGFPS